MAVPFDLDRLGGARGLRELVDVVLAAGEDALRLQRAGVAARYEAKADHSPVTEADRTVEQRLRDYCARRYPEVPFVGEEAGTTGGTQTGLRFIVDPIDGTRAFIRDIPSWSVLLGLEDEHGPALGIGLMPGHGDLFVGVRGDGAQGNGRPLRVSTIHDPGAALVCHGGLDQFVSAGQEAVLGRLARTTWTQRGFADLEGYRHVLLGRAEAMIDVDVKAWDLCVPAVLVREAGGRFTSLRGEDTIEGGSALASNGAVHDALVSSLSAPRPSS